MQIESNGIEPMTDEHVSLLAEYRKNRGFNVEKYVELKVKLLNTYMNRSGLKAVVVATSGGIDSAVVLALCKKASESNGIRVVSVSLPSYHNRGVVNQTRATEYAQKLCEKLNVEHMTIDVNHSVEVISMYVREGFGMDKTASNWAYGQLTPYTRTPFLYYITTILKEQGFPAVLVGTTNRDEGAYLGYVGKASDGMVDIQLISDLHKSEVRAVAKYLGVTDEILNVTPTGDMFDGRCDEELFGATYDFVELYLQNRVSCKAADNLEKMHRYNSHKYFVGSPAVHLDLYESGVEGGWPLQFESKFWKKLKEFFPDHHDLLLRAWNMKKEYKMVLGTDSKIIENERGIIRVVGVITVDMWRFFQEYITTKIPGTNMLFVAEKIKHS